MKRDKLLVAAIENGTVIDHIPSNRLFDVINLLHLEKMKTAVTVGFNLKSADIGHKSIIKVADKFFTDEELNQLSIVAPNVTLCIIRNYDIVEKRTVVMPELLVDTVKCSNPKCITNNEPMQTRFRAIGANGDILRCCYCNRDIPRSEVKVKVK